MPDFSGNLEPGELRLKTEHRWWLVDDLLRSAEHFAPDGIGHLQADLIEKGSAAYDGRDRSLRGVSDS